jgi:hypothetical protein
MRRYQDLINVYLSQGLQNIIEVLNAQPTPMQVDSVLAEQQVLNMINTKYFILNPSGQPLRNPQAMGHAWLVENYMVVEDATAEYTALGVSDLTRTAVVDKRFAGLLSEDLKHIEPQGSVVLTEYRPNHITYKADLKQKSLVVFSDVFYEGGWHAKIDGEPVEHLRANYILRALPANAGEHTIEFEFRFKPFEAGGKISRAGSILVLLVLLGGLTYQVYTWMSKKPEE